MIADASITSSSREKGGKGGTASRESSRPPVLPPVPDHWLQNEAERGLYVEGFETDQDSEDKTRPMAEPQSRRTSVFKSFYSFVSPSRSVD